MAIWLARLAIDRWRQAERCAPGEGADAHPTALIAETAHGPRLTAVNATGRDAGAGPGMMLADARAVCPALKAVPSDPAGDRAFLERLALWTQRWGLFSALDLPDGLLVDVTAAAHLFGGEDALLADAQARLAGEELTVRLAIAPTGGAAWALAHFGPERAVLKSSESIEEQLAGLPVAALRLDADAVLVLRRLGLKRIGDLTGIGRDALHRRFRNRRVASANPLVRMDQLLGRLPEPLLPVVAVPVAMAQRRLMEPIRHRELLDQVVGDLTADLARELELRGEGARRLELAMGRVDDDVLVRSLELAAATRDPAHLARLYAAKLDDVDAGFGIEWLRLRAVWSEPLALAQADIEAGAEDHGISLAACLDRLAVRLGADAVRRPIPHASHIPERAQRWQAPLAAERGGQEELAFHVRPLKLLDKAESIDVTYATPDGYPRQFRWRGQVHDIARVEGPERIAPEWWREKGRTRLRDYYRIEDSVGARYWIYRLGLVDDGRGGLPEWFLHGLCA